MQCTSACKIRAWSNLKFFCVLGPHANRLAALCCLWLHSHVGIFPVAAFDKGLPSQALVLLLWVRDANRHQPRYDYGLGAILLKSYALCCWE